MPPNRNTGPADRVGHTNQRPSYCFLWILSCVSDMLFHYLSWLSDTSIYPLKNESQPRKTNTNRDQASFILDFAGNPFGGGSAGDDTRFASGRLHGYVNINDDEDCA